jgi:hypothetical protein
MPNIAPHGKLHVYEVINYDRRESLVALVADGLGALVNRLESPRPPPIAHWAPAEAFVVEQIAAAMPAADVDAFLEDFLAKTRGRGWKMLVWRG